MTRLFVVVVFSHFRRVACRSRVRHGRRHSNDLDRNDGAAKLSVADGVRPVGLRQVHAVAQAVRRVPGQIRLLRVAHHPAAQAIRGGRAALSFRHQGTNAGGHRPRRVSRARRVLRQHVRHQVRLLPVCVCVCVCNVHVSGVF